MLSVTQSYERLTGHRDASLRTGKFYKMADGRPLKRKFKEKNEFFVIRAKGESVVVPKSQEFDGRDFSKAKGWYQNANHLALRDC